MKNRKKIIAAVLAAVIVIAAVIWCVPPKTHSAEGYAMGSAVSVTVYGGKNSDEAAAAAVEKIKELDSVYLSHTEEGSFTYRLNAGREVEADSEYLKIIKDCLLLSEDCAGFSILCGALENLWNIEGGGYVPSDSEIEEGLLTVDGSNIEIDKTRVTLKNGAIVTLGALGKGMACQQAVNLLKESGAKNGLCTVGGSVGVFGSPGRGKDFKIGIRNPFGEANEYFATLSLSDCFISTSGNYEKYFEKDSVRYCHIFDAETGSPVQNGLSSVTVIADNGTLSDFLSTAVYILGEGRGIALAEKYNARVIIVRDDKSVLMSEGLEDCFELTDESFTVL